MTSMQVTKILTATTVKELQAVGSFREVKNNLENELKVKLGVVSWKALFDKIDQLQTSVLNNKSALLTKCDNGTFKERKKEISKLLGLTIKARGWRELTEKIHNIINTFHDNIFDPYVHYEAIKSSNFKHSSKLEGIYIEASNEKASLESVLAKYGRHNNG